MNKLFTLALVLVTGSVILSCEADSSENENSTARTAPVTGKQLKIVNNSDFKMTGEIYCYGAEGNTSVNPNIRIMGKATVPSNMEITYKNFTQVSNLNYRINPWFVSSNGNSPIAYSAIQTNQVYGQLYAPGVDSKYANWRYLKVQFTTTTIPGLVHPITMVIELPHYSNNNSAEIVMDLSQYGLQQDLHLSQSSLINQAGNTVLTIESELVDQAN